MDIRTQSDFPFLEQYGKIFEIDSNTVFALGGSIYTNHPLTPDLLVHELVHLRQQEVMGVKEWLYDFLYVPQKRLNIELEAYREQLKSIKDRNKRAKVHSISAKQLSSALYGNIISKSDAYEALKV